MLTLNSSHSAEKADLAWVAVSQLKDQSSGQFHYPHLVKVMMLILSISHSKAADERLFSLVRKNKTEFRSSLSTPTLSDVFTQNVTCQSKGQKCYWGQIQWQTLDQIQGSSHVILQTERRKQASKQWDWTLIVWLSFIVCTIPGTELQNNEYLPNS